MQAKADPDKPGLTNLSVDALGMSTFRTSPLRVHTSKLAYRVEHSGQRTRYYAGASRQSLWEIRIETRSILFVSRYSSSATAEDLKLEFDPNLCHATLLGRTAVNGDVRLPAVLHLPGMGSLRVTSREAAETTLEYHSRRNTGDYVLVGLRTATKENPVRTYRFDVISYSPNLSVKSDSLPLEGFRRDYLDGLQLNAELHVLANNAASDACPFTLYEAADIAMYAPPLAKGLRAIDLIGETLDRYAEGFKGYGMPGSQMFDAPADHSFQPYTFSDVYPSLLISAYDYVSVTGNTDWLKARYSTLVDWTGEMLQGSSQDNGLILYPVSGNSGSWTSKITVRPANWWDTIGFGHEDAWSNALAFRALRSMAALAKMEGDDGGAKKYAERAALLKSHYASTLLDPATGLIAGWRSSDGRLHDYQFLFVNGAAVRYGLLDQQMEEDVVQAILKHLAMAGYTHFDLGLPGNLIPVRREDYVDLDPRFGGSEKADGSDGFQIYENGGATAAFAYFTVAALYKTHHDVEADRILIPMLKSFSQQGFSGRGRSGMTNDWKDWQGQPHGYEGFLADNYYAFLCVLEREHRGPAVP